MGRLYQFPVARVRRSVVRAAPRHSTAGLFTAFYELRKQELAALKLLAACAAMTILLVAALQLATYWSR